MLTKLSQLVVVFTWLATAAPMAFADCYKDGVAYPAGTVIGGFVCTKDGAWVRG